MSHGIELSLAARDSFATANNLRIVEPIDDGAEHCELFIDLDDEFDLQGALALAEAAGLRVTYVGATPSRTEGHRHVVLAIDLTGTIWDEMMPELRIALQCVFGSDRKRELLSLASLLSSQQPQPTVFFEKERG